MKIDFNKQQTLDGNLMVCAFKQMSRLYHYNEMHFVITDLQSNFDSTKSHTTWDDTLLFHKLNSGKVFLFGKVGKNRIHTQHGFICIAPYWVPSISFWLPNKAFHNSIYSKQKNYICHISSNEGRAFVFLTHNFTDYLVIIVFKTSSFNTESMTGRHA